MSEKDKRPLSLDEGDLLSELDQWGDMFDALHEEPATGVRDQTPPAAAAPASAAPAPAPAPVTAPVTTPAGIVDETDFSDLGIDATPEAIGALLGPPPPLAEVEGEEEPSKRPSQPPRRPSARRLGTEEEVFTSASRPSVARLPQAPTDDELFGDLMNESAPEAAPKPVEVTPRAPSIPRPPSVPRPASTPRVSRPAIVRREDLARKREEGFAGGESTRVADVAELDALRDDGDFVEGPFGTESTRVASYQELDSTQRRAARRTDAPPVPRTTPRTTPPSPPPARPSANVLRRDQADFGRDDSGVFAGPEQTRIAEFDQLEKLAEADAAAAKAHAEAAAAAAQSLFDEQPAIELTVDDDFYADFEIGDQGTGETHFDTPSSLTPSARRTTAHIVRRTNPPTSPVPLVKPVVMEIEADAGDEFELAPRSGEISTREVAPMPELAEDDFSGIAEEVQAAAEAAVRESDEVTGEAPAAAAAPAPAPAPAAVPAARAAAAAEPESGLAAAVAAAAEAAWEADAEATEERAAAAPPVAFPAAPATPSAADTSAVDAIPVAIPENLSEAAGAAARAAAALAGPDVTPELPPPVFSAVEPSLDLDAIVLPELVDPTGAPDPAEEAARLILVYERELETVDEGALAAALRCEAARLYERIGDGDRARLHYEAALLHDPRSFTALRGLRRVARAAGDLGDATRHLDAEIGIAGALERRPLALHRIDLLMVSGEQDLARVAVGELLDEAKGDVRALLAQLELAFVDGRVDELAESLERLAAAVSDDGLRAALAVALGHLRERPDSGDPARARTAFSDASGAGPGSVPPLLGMRRTGEPRAAVAATAALAELAASTGDPAAAAGLMLRTAALAAGAEAPELAVSSVDRARGLAGRDPLVAEALYGAASTLPGTEGLTAQIDALAILGEVAPAPAARTWAYAHEAMLRLDRDAEGDLDAALAAIARAAALDPTHDHLSAAHEAQLAGAGDWLGVADLALARVHVDPGAERDRVTAARALAAAGAVGRAIELLEEGRELTPGSPTLADVLSDALAVAGRWSDRVALWSATAGSDAETLDPELSTLRAAAAAEEAVAAAAATAAVEGDPDREDVGRAVTAGIEAWSRVLEIDPDSHRGHAAAIALARRLGDPDVLADTLARAQGAYAPRSPAAAVTLGLERARSELAGADPDYAGADAVLAELPAEDPRRLAAELVLSARAGRWSDAALFLEERGTAAAEAGSTQEAVALRYRAAQLLLDRGDDVGRAAQLLGQVLDDRPQLAAAADALGAARRRLGDAAAVGAPSARVTAAELGTGADAFARVVREAELVGAQGDAPAAIALLTRALELRSADPLATAPLIRIAHAAGEPAPLTRLALEELAQAEESGDARARADAYETLARVDAELRGDPGSALVAWESAIEADPSREWVLRQIARQYIAQGRWADLYAVRGRQIAAIPRELETGGDQADAIGLAIDRAALAEKEGLSDDELRAIYQDIVERDRRHRYALFQLESLVRRGGASTELAGLEAAIAELFPDDPRARAAFLTRAGETLVETGQLEAAIERFQAADEAARRGEGRGGYVPALQGWRLAALKGGLWIDVAEAASREAALIADKERAAQLYHLAGATLMDGALAAERAVPVLHKALAADPTHHDAFVRLRILLDEQGQPEDLARLLEERLVVEDDRDAKIRFHRALAELYRNFLGDRESAKYNLRAILELEPNDLRAVATLSDICWEQGAWAEAAEALVQRARLESDPTLLRHLYYRLGTIYADRIPQPDLALKAFQRVLAADPEDNDALARIADLGIATGEWKMALGACERLVRAEQDPERRVAHLHRVARIFQEGFDDRAKAERAYRMALDGAPTSDAALTRLVEFYQDAGDVRTLRMHVDRVALLMRKQLEREPTDGAAARVIARAMAARQAAGAPGSLEVARCAAELARGLGALPDDDPDVGLAAPVPGDVRVLARVEAEDLLFPRSAPPELRQIFALLGERVAKHVGVDLRPYGVTRGDRLRTRESPVATVAQEVADQLGLGEIDVYISQRQPMAMQAEPTSPVSLVIGAQLATSAELVRFAAGGALKLAHAQLAIVARMPEQDLAALTVALLRLFVPDLPYLRAEQEQIATQIAKLRRLIPSGLLTELRPYVLALDLGAFDHEAFQRAVIIGGLRAGIRASGSLMLALQVLAAQRGAADLRSILHDPVARDLVQFALGEDHARLVQLPVG